MKNALGTGKRIFGAERRAATDGPALAARHCDHHRGKELEKDSASTGATPVCSLSISHLHSTLGSLEIQFNRP